jgi:hypothetical protein
MVEQQRNRRATSPCAMQLPQMVTASPPPVARAYPTAPGTEGSPEANKGARERLSSPCSPMEGEPFMPMQFKDGLDNGAYGLGKSPFDTCIF